jgi:hypothetical protein
MAKSTISGPLIVYGNETTPPGASARSADQNPDAGPSPFYGGTSILDPRAGWTFYTGQAANSPPVMSWIAPDIIALDFAPLAAATANIAALQTMTANVPLTLASVTAGDVTVSDTFKNALTGATVTALRVGAKPAALPVGTSAMTNIWNVTTLGSRAVSITAGGTTLAGIVFTVSGYDIYGFPQTEAITGPAAGTVNGKKTWKWISSVTPNGNSTQTVSIGTADIFGLPIKGASFPYVQLYWNNIVQLTAQYTVPDLTSPATTLTGDVRGTFTPSASAADGTKRLVAFVTIPVANIAVTTQAALLTGMFGVQPV